MSKLYRFNASGVIVSGSSTTAPVDDIWSCTWHGLYPDAADNASVLAVAVDRWHTLFATPTTGIGNNCRTRTIKANVIDPLTGLQITDPTVQQEVDYAGGHAAGGATFIANRLSMSDGTRSKHGRGGFFLPAIGSSIGQDGRFQPEDMANVATNAAAFVMSFRGADELPLLVIYSPSQHAAYPIRQVRVGDVPDIIRKRKNAMQENYHTIATP